VPKKIFIENWFKKNKSADFWNFTCLRKLNRERYPIAMPIKRGAMRTCQNIRKKLSAYQDGEVGTADKDVIETHLRTCKTCAKEHEALLKTYRMLRSLPAIEPTPEFSRQIMDRATRVQEVFWAQFLGQALRLLPIPSAIVAAAVAGLLLGTMSGNFLTKRQFSPPWTLSAFHSGQALTLASVRVFDAAPPGSFAEGYLQLAGQNPERSYEK
jgi:anti-sigma factor RsiW